MMPILGLNASKFALFFKNAIKKIQMLSHLRVIGNLVGAGIFGSYMASGPQRVRDEPIFLETCMKASGMTFLRGKWSMK